MKRSGFTLVELLTCLAIIAVLAAILFPVFAHSQTAAFERRSISDMKQIATAAIIYTEAWKTQEYGDMASMGLPQDYPVLFNAKISANSGGWPAPPIHPDDFPGYYYMPLPKKIDGREITWEAAALQYRDNTLLVCDPWLNNKGEGNHWNAYDFTLPNEMNGISLGGNLLKKKRYGPFIDFSRWQ